MYKQNGTHQVFDDLELTDFFWKIKFVGYDWFTGQDFVEVYFTPTEYLMTKAIEGKPGFGTNSRSYLLPPSNSGTPEQALAYILSLDQFKNSVKL